MLVVVGEVKQSNNPPFFSHLYYRYISPLLARTYWTIEIREDIIHKLYVSYIYI
jgi:hypothetical protein